MPKTTNEKIQNIQAEIQQLENQRKRLMQQQKEAERKARTKRLIERGAILESFIPDAMSVTNEQIKQALQSSNISKILDSIALQEYVPATALSTPAVTAVVGESAAGAPGKR